jgi:hypothetical protein
MCGFVPSFTYDSHNLYTHVRCLKVFFPLLVLWIDLVWAFKVISLPYVRCFLFSAVFVAMVCAYMCGCITQPTYILVF